MAPEEIVDKGIFLTSIHCLLICEFYSANTVWLAIVRCNLDSQLNPFVGIEYALSITKRLNISLHSWKRCGQNQPKSSTRNWRVKYRHSFTQYIMIYISKIFPCLSMTFQQNIHKIIQAKYVLLYTNLYWNIRSWFYIHFQCLCNSLIIISRSLFYSIETGR